MAIISKTQKLDLYKDAKYACGYPQRPFELLEEQMDSFLKLAIEDYSKLLNNWLIEQQWVSVQGLHIDSANFVEAYTSKSTDFIHSFTYAYSKQVGLGTNAPAGDNWHLKKDFVVISADTQIYTIPAGREINEILWFTPPQIDSGLVDPFALNNWSPGQFGWSYLGRPASYVQPTYSLLLNAQDRSTKKRILQSELTYRIAGGPSGTKLLFLYPIPGTRNEISNGFGKHLQGSKVWYFYYDINNKGRKKCLEQNNDIVKLPSDAPIDNLKWDKLNTVARTQVRDLFFARCMKAMGKMRGFFSGDVGATTKQLTMDYRMLLEDGEKLEAKITDEILKALTKLSLVNLTKERADIAENVNKAMGYQPFDNPIMRM